MSNVDLTALPPTAATQPITVYTAATWGSAFVARPDLRVIHRSWSIAPQVSSAMLEYRYGSVMLPGANAYSTLSKITARGYFVLIVQGADVGASPLYWLGYAEDAIEERAVRSHSGDPASGVQTVPCFGMEQLLYLSDITTSVHADPQDSEAWKRKYFGSAFNRQLKGNRTAEKVQVDPEDGGAEPLMAHVFQNPFPETRNWWSSRDILEHLFFFHLPTSTGLAGTIPWSIASASMVPNWDRPMVESDGVSVGSVLDEILSPSRMLGWKVAPVIAAGPPPSVSALQIVPFTRAASAISLPSVGSLPANADVSTFASVGDPLTDVAVDVDSSEAVDQVVVQGPREIGVGTLRPSEHTPAWKTSDQLDYDDAFSNDPGWAALKRFKKQEFNHVFRTRDKYRDVYSYRVIPPTWNGLTDLTDRFFVANPDESDYVPFLENVEVLPELPLYAGIDYEGDPEQIDESAGRRFLPMQTLVEKPDDPTFYMRLPVASTRSSGWTRFQQANTVQYDVSVSPDNSRGPGFRIEVSGAPQHAIAGSIFNGNDADEPQAIYGGISYLTFLFTCALRGDRRPFHALPASVSSDVVRRRVITLEHPGLQHVHIAAATVVDITKEGDPVYSDGGVLRDPGPILQSLATLAYNQYVVPRYHVRVSTGRILGSLGPGSLLSVVNGVAANAVIRQIEISTPVAENHTPPPQRMTIVASTNEVDLVDLIGRVPAPEASL